MSPVSGSTYWFPAGLSPSFILPDGPSAPDITCLIVAASQENLSLSLPYQ